MAVLVSAGTLTLVNEDGHRWTDPASRWRIIQGHPNKNPVLVVMRDALDDTDPWGTAISWAFAVAEVLHTAAEFVPEEMEYRPSPTVSRDPDEEPEDYPDVEVWHLVNKTPGHWVDPQFGATYDDLRFAGKCLARYLDWCRAAGLDY